MAKERIALDLPDISNFRPRQGLPDVANSEDVREAAEAAGFKTRHGGGGQASKTEPVSAPFDARSLRRTGRTSKLNIATREATRERFWQLARAMDLVVGEDVLIALMDSYQRQKDSD